MLQNKLHFLFVVLRLACILSVTSNEGYVGKINQIAAFQNNSGLLAFNMEHIPVCISAYQEKNTLKNNF